MRLLTDTPVKGWILIGLAALIFSGFAQRQVEVRRTETHLTWTNPEEKQALEVGFLALGGFRGILADILWIRAIGQQDNSREYELKLLCDMILRLQPTFTQVHAFQGYNMSYNLAYKAETCEDKWYWVRSGLATLENGLKRNLYNYNLWFEMGFQYFDRLGEQKMGKCFPLCLKELPNIDEMKGDTPARTEELRRTIFSEDQENDSGKRAWEKGHARKDEHWRLAAYFFFKAMETRTEQKPLRTERTFGQCLEHLGHWRSKKPPNECRAWDDWGAEEWWVEIRRRNIERGMVNEDTVPTNLRFCMWIQMDFFLVKSEKSKQEHDLEGAAKWQQGALETYLRYNRYFPEDGRSMEKMLKVFRDYRDRDRTR